MNDIDQGGNTKWLTVAQLRKVLSELPDNALVQPNAVGNLMVNADDGRYLGFIDFLFDGEFI